MQFNEFNLNEGILKSLSENGYETPTEIQQESIPTLLESKVDFVGLAQTGTGKTAAFLLPLLNRLGEAKKSGALRALILTPTRELAKQVDGEFKKLGCHTSLKSTVIYGGASYDKQKSELRTKKPEVIIGTPGRIIDLMKQGVLSFKNSDYLILDEADEMLKMGFIDDVQSILESFNERRNIWMFSATMPKGVLNLINASFQAPIFVKTKKAYQSNENINQEYVIVNRKDKLDALHRFMICDQEISGIVFCRTRAETKEVTDGLIEKGISVDCLNGDMSQHMREMAMGKFRQGRTKILVCTDVAARGIDIKDLSHVFNYGLPQDAESYTHRIGRTGRAGSQGKAITIIDPSEISQLRRYERILKMKLEKGAIPSSTEVKKTMVSSELEKLRPAFEALVDKGEEFQLDETYEYFREYFSDASKEDIQKLLFTSCFNKPFRRLKTVEDLTSQKIRVVNQRSGRSFRGRGRGRDERSERGGQRGGQRSGERGGERGGQRGGSRSFRKSSQSESGRSQGRNFR